jgi:predicted regulator of Ras-like GTPase activity (Roadblock/LC7/MglB family)
MRKFLLALVLLVPALALAQVPLQVHYQGYLTNSAGVPINVPTSITLRLYDQPSAGSMVFEETHAAVPVANGVFKVIIGSVQPLALAVFDTARHLSLQAGADAEMSPRLALGTAPFAYVAERANQLSGTATVQGSQVTGTIAGATISGGTLAQLQGQFVGALQPTSVAANVLTTVDSAGLVGQYASIAIGADALPVIAYYDAINGDLKVAKCANTACTGTSTLSTVDSAEVVGIYTSIAIGADGLPVIAYYDGGIGHLKVAKCTNAACTTGTSTLTTVDSGVNVGLYPSIAIGADALPVVAYQDGGNGDLKVAKCTNAACTASTLSTVDSAGNAGQFASVAIGADGLPVIAYNDGSNFDLKVAKCVDAACTTGTSTLSTVDADGVVGFHNSIAIGADGLPVIAYFHNANGDLKVAKCSNAACTAGTSALSTVDSVGIVGIFISIAIGADGLPVISYYDVTNLDLKVAKCANAACTAGTSTLSTVDSAGEVGLHTSIAIGADGLPVIAYHGGVSGNLKVAKCANVYCGPYFWRR